MSEIRHTTLQIMPIAPGWTFNYVWFAGEEANVEVLPVAALALVEKRYPGYAPDDPDGVENKIEAVVLEDGSFHAEWELFFGVSNAESLGILAPNENVAEDVIERAKERYIRRELERVQRVSGQK